MRERRKQGRWSKSSGNRKTTKPLPKKRKPALTSSNATVHKTDEHLKLLRSQDESGWDADDSDVDDSDDDNDPSELWKSNTSESDDLAEVKSSTSKMDVETNTGSPENRPSTTPKKKKVSRSQGESSDNPTFEDRGNEESPPKKKQKTESHSTPKLLPCKDGTSKVLKNNKDKRVIIVQFGGGTGSEAGDAAVISARKSRRMVVQDRGRDNEKQRVEQHSAQNRFIQQERDEKQKIVSQNSEFESDLSDAEVDTPNSKAATGNKAHFIGNITHNHADHIGDELEKANFDILYHGESIPENMPKKPIKKKLEKTGDKIFSWRTKEGKTKSEDKKQIYLAGKALVPKSENTKIDENSKSTGALITVDRGKDKTRVFTMLTLGDATPDALAREVDEMVKGDNHPINLVKMAHHGSEHNILTMPPQHTNDNMIVVLSGYTKGYGPKAEAFLNRDIPNLKKKIEGVNVLLGEDKKNFNELKKRERTGEQLDNNDEKELNEKQVEYGYKWKKLYILCQSEGIKTEIETAARFLNDREDIELVRDLVISIDDDGTVTIEPTTWA